MTNIVWTQSALQTLELVYLQTLQYTKNERIAAKLHNKLIKEAEMLRTFPNAGNILNSRPLKSTHLRDIARKQCPADFFNK